MFGTVLSALLAAQAPVQLASVGFTAVKLPRALVSSLEETFAHRLSEGGLVRVTTQKDVVTLLGVERQKQLLGCADDGSSCLAELAGALGSEGFIRGDVAQAGRVLQVTIRILTPTGGVLFSGLRRVKGEEAALAAIDELAAEALQAVLPKLRPSEVAKQAEPVVTPVEPVKVATTAAPTGPGAGPWVLAGLGAAVLVTGGVLQGFAIADYTALRDPVTSNSDALTRRDGGKLKQGLGLSFIGAGGVAVVAGVLWAMLGASVSTSAWLAPSGGGVAVSGVCP
jgi:hypothetical protein